MKLWCRIFHRKHWMFDSRTITSGLGNVWIWFHCDYCKRKYGMRFFNTHKEQK